MTSVQRMIQVYDHATVRHPSRYYANSGFYNFGYWGAEATSQAEASQALVDLLTERIVLKGGRILDVACGVGASTRRLLDSYPADMISAINISELQLAQARKNVPECTFLQMDAARLEFPDNFFNAVICVEAAFHFNTRAAFLREAFRVLKPGGSLALSDILFRTPAAPLASFFHVPRANLLADIESYRRQLEAIGYDAVDITDATGATVRAFCQQLSAWPASQYHAGHSSLGKTIKRTIGYRAAAACIAMTCKRYLVVACRKPTEHVG
ncbi:MAG: methyltransferase domain-containing protein [Xanthobacteraceae bacterium]